MGPLHGLVVDPSFQKEASGLLQWGKRRLTASEAGWKPVPGATISRNQSVNHPIGGAVPSNGRPAQEAGRFALIGECRLEWP